MQRRELIKTLTGIFGVAVTLPSWAGGWTAAALPEPAFLSKTQKSNLSELVNTIIPRTDTPGAADLGIHHFVELMVKDCFEKKVQDQLREGLDGLDGEAQNKFGRRFTTLDSEERLNLVRSLAETKDTKMATFLNAVKSLTIQGYTSSEYFMTNVSRYELVPGRYHGCVDIGS